MADEAAFEPTIPTTLDAPEVNEGVPVKYPEGVLRVILPYLGTVVFGVNTRTGKTVEPTPFEAMVTEVKAVIATACRPVTQARAIRT